jgi:hypothetical protein
LYRKTEKGRAAQRERQRAFRRNQRLRLAVAAARCEPSVTQQGSATPPNAQVLESETTKSGRISAKQDRHETHPSIASPPVPIGAIHCSICGVACSPFVRETSWAKISHPFRLKLRRQRRASSAKSSSAGPTDEVEH